jgi:hypothetical protein
VAFKVGQPLRDGALEELRTHSVGNRPQLPQGAQKCRIRIETFGTSLTGPTAAEGRLLREQRDSVLAMTAPHFAEGGQEAPFFLLSAPMIFTSKGF